MVINKKFSILYLLLILICQPLPIGLRRWAIGDRHKRDFVSGYFSRIFLEIWKSGLALKKYKEDKNMMGENNVGDSSANLDSGILDIVESRIQNKKEDEEKKEK
jgi:hypothetical protein